MTYSKELAKLLDASGMSRAECAAYLNISARTLAYWLSGKIEPANPIEREAYLRALSAKTAESRQVPPAA